jgi:anti-sigma factor RsiW
MNCRDAQELLSALIDEQVTDAEEIAVRAHLESCPACRDALSEIEQAAAAVRDLPRVEVGRDFTDRVMARVGRERSRRAPGERWTGWRAWTALEFLPAPALRVAAALVLGLLVGFGAARLGGNGARSSLVAEQAPALPVSRGGESLGVAGRALAPSDVERGWQSAHSAAGEIDYVLDRYTLVPGQTGESAAGGARRPPAVANRDVIVRF